MGLIFESILTEVLFILLLLLWYLYANITREYSYWKERGVPHINPVFPFGSLKDSFLGTKPRGELYNQFYNKFKNERYFGLHEIRKPVLVVKDPDLIKHILVKDFHHFTSRFVFPIDKKKNYISWHLFNMTGQEWKQMRLKLTPTFTSGRMKSMFILMAKCGEQLQKHVHNHIQSSPIVDIKDVLARFTMDIIASCAFGLEINSLENKSCTFYEMGMKIFQVSTMSMIRRIMFTIFPFMNKIITSRFVTPDVTDFLTNIIRDTVKYREENNITRNDFLDLLIRVRQNRSLVEDEKPNNGNNTLNLAKTDLSIEEITAQCFIFFFAGFETASSTMTFCLYELSCHPNIQEQLYQEVKKVLERHGNTISYQALQEMTFMDQVINETLRLYASLPSVDRTCTEPYKIPGSDLVLQKGQFVTIPTYAIHHDPELYPHPFKFDPARFSPDKIQDRHPYIHLPFGEGPRMCIGMRFGLMQTKIGLTEMISNFEFTLTPETQIPVTLHKRSFVTQPEKPIMLHLTERKSEI